MSPKLEHYQIELRQRVDEVLHYIWDPIGVAGVPEARDEYDAYIPSVYAVLTKKETEKKELYTLLLDISTGNMGLNKGKFLKDRAEKAEELLLHWAKMIQSQDDYHTK